MPHKNIEDRRKYHNQYRLKKRRAAGAKPRTKKTKEQQAIDQRAASRRHYYKNREAEIARSKISKAKNKALQRIFDKRKRAKRRGAKGRYTLGEWISLKRKYGGLCVHCQRSEKEVEITADHILPLSKGGSNYISNIQPLCRSCNSSKQNKVGVRAETQLLKFEEWQR